MEECAIDTVLATARVDTVISDRCWFRVAFQREGAFSSGLVLCHFVQIFLLFFNMGSPITPRVFDVVY